MERNEIKKQEEIVRVECIEHHYPDKTEILVCGMEFVVHRGEKVALVGTNGSGKTTLLLHLIGLLRAEKGKVEVFGKDPSREFSKIGKKIGVVVQNVEDQLIGPTVFDDILFSPLNYGWELSQAEERARGVMKELRIEHLKNKVIHYLSGGEKKRVALAGAFVVDPELLILDEALAELDPENTELILKKLDDMSREKNTAILMTTNELSVVEKFADVVYVLENGKISFRGTVQEFFRFQKDCKVCRH